MTMTQDAISHFETQLKQERLRVLSTIESLRDELSHSITDETEENGLETHLGENATVTFLRERDLSIEEHEAHLLHEIDAALDRVGSGTFGVCAACGEPIANDRLEALPWAARCISCQHSAGE